MATSPVSSIHRLFSGNDCNSLCRWERKNNAWTGGNETALGCGHVTALHTKDSCPLGAKHCQSRDGEKGNQGQLIWNDRTGQILLINPVMMLDFQSTLLTWTKCKEGHWGLRWAPSTRHPEDAPSCPVSGVCRFSPNSTNQWRLRWPCCRGISQTSHFKVSQVGRSARSCLFPQVSLRISLMSVIGGNSSSPICQGVLWSGLPPLTTSLKLYKLTFTSINPHSTF